MGSLIRRIAAWFAAGCIAGLFAVQVVILVATPAAAVTWSDTNCTGTSWSISSWRRTDAQTYAARAENEGYEWIDFHNWEESIISFIRKDRATKEIVLVVCNLTPMYRPGYRVGVPAGGYWKEALNSDASEYGGSGKGNMGGVEAERIQAHRREYSVNITLPPLSTLLFKHSG